MAIINLRDFYLFYTSDCFMEVSDEVAEMFKEFDRKEAAYIDMMSISQLIIISGLIYNPVPYERVTAACKNRAEPGADITGKGGIMVLLFSHRSCKEVARRGPRRGEIPVGRFAVGR